MQFSLSLAYPPILTNIELYLLDALVIAALASGAAANVHNLKTVYAVAWDRCSGAQYHPVGGVRSVSIAGAVGWKLRNLQEAPADCLAVHRLH